MAGLEVDSIAPVAQPFTGVVVGEVTHTEQHPNADRLRVCQVNVGSSQLLPIVCGGANVRPDLKVAVAVVGATLGADFKIKKAKLRGCVSEGMLCSASELGLAESSSGILELPADAPIGEDVRHYLQLDDNTLDIDLTPNRGDCLSVAGIAREVGVLTQSEVRRPDIQAVTASIDDQFPIACTASDACPHYVGRVIRGVDMQAATPLWMQERLRRSGLRSIDVVVDVTNYVMLELGQPMHAFDYSRLQGGIEVRYAKPDETLTLLNGETVTIKANTLVIADQQQVLALAGIMGGEASAVNGDTVDIFLESAYFVPKVIAGRARHYGLFTDSSHRFERGVDPHLQRLAVERATQLLLMLTSGQAGPVIEYSDEAHLPTPSIVTLRPRRLTQVLGVTIPEETALDSLQRLGMEVFTQGERWEVHVPTFRFDIHLEADLIEEIARVYGYDNIPTHHPVSQLTSEITTRTQVPLHQFCERLVTRGYHEAITYSFVDPKRQALLEPNLTALSLLNPLSAELSVMRTSLWPGLLDSLKYNLNRQQERVRLFETGLRFIQRPNDVQQIMTVAGLVTGAYQQEAWANSKRDVDFFDVKADVEALLHLAHVPSQQYRFVAAEHPSLHPGKSAQIWLKEHAVGWLGALHPRVQQHFGVPSVYVFQLDIDAIDEITEPRFKSVSKFPAVRRDLSFFVDEKVSAQQIRELVDGMAQEWLQTFILFDVYRDDTFEAGQKSMAIGLVLQHAERTLLDEETTALLDNIIAALQQTYHITLRDE